MIYDRSLLRSTVRGIVIIGPINQLVFKKQILSSYGGYELFLEGVPVPPGLPFEAFETPDIGLSILSKVIYIASGFLLSILISQRRQLA